VVETIEVVEGGKGIHEGKEDMVEEVIEWV